jgi:hypothetical protein
LFTLFQRYFSICCVPGWQSVGNRLTIRARLPAREHRTKKQKSVEGSKRMALWVSNFSQPCNTDANLPKRISQDRFYRYCVFRNPTSIGFFHHQRGTQEEKRVIFFAEHIHASYTYLKTTHFSESGIEVLQVSNN